MSLGKIVDKYEMKLERKAKVKSIVHVSFEIEENETLFIDLFSFRQA